MSESPGESRKHYSKEAIVDAAFGIVREKGLDALSARAVAAALNASTMPIYTSARSMETVEAEVRARAAGLLKEYQQRDYAGDPYLNMALGYVEFARGEKNLFRLLFLERPRISGDVISEETAAFPGAPPGGIDSDQLGSLALKMWAFTHGLAMLVFSGAGDDLDRKRIAALLAEAGQAFHAWEVSRQ